MKAYCATDGELSLWFGVNNEEELIDFIDNNGLKDFEITREEYQDPVPQVPGLFKPLICWDCHNCGATLDGESIDPGNTVCGEKKRVESRVKALKMLIEKSN